MKLNPEQIERALVSAVTQYDKKQAARAAKNPRAHHNHNALPIYLGRVDEIMADIKAGTAPALAIRAGFSGPLETACFRALGIDPKVVPDTSPGGPWYYVPASGSKG